MEWLVVVFVIVVAVAAIALKNPGFVSAKRSNSTHQNYTYQLRGTLLTPAEFKFYQVLQQAVGNQSVIFAKVRVADILTPQKGLSKSDWQRAFNKISAKHFDFVLCDRARSNVQVVIELDDKSHSKSSRTNRDQFLNQATQKAGLKLIRFPVKASYSAADIQDQVLPLLK